MKIIVPYFNENNDYQIEKTLKFWVFFYKRSVSKYPAILLTDKYSPVPKFWEYDVKRIEDPPFIIHPLNKGGWMKSQAYKIFNDKCLILDSDAFLLKNSDELNEIECDMAMSLSGETPRQGIGKRHYPFWEKANPELQGGVQIHNSIQISEKFTELYEKRKGMLSHLKDINLEKVYTQLIFSEICLEIGTIIDEKYNWVCHKDCSIYFNKNPNILHILGEHKKLERILGQITL